MSPHLGILSALLLATSSLALSVAPSSVTAGPREARQRWKEAQGMKSSSWRERLQMLRAARSEASDSDPLYAKVLSAEARVLREAAHVEAGAATDAAAARSGPRREPDRLALALSAARTLVSDGDGVGATPLLLEVLEAGGSATPWITAPALEILARLAAEGGDVEALSSLVRREAHLVPGRYEVRLVTLDLLGLAILGAGDVPGARKVYADQKRLFDEAQRSSDEAARLASKAWLELLLPKSLEGR